MKNIQSIALKFSPALLIAWTILVAYVSYLHVQHTLMKSNPFFSTSAAAPLDYAAYDDVTPTYQQASADDTGCGCPSCCAITNFL